MSASLRTKDGSASVVGAILASEKAASRYVPIDMEGALEWARDNTMKLKGVRRPRTHTGTITVHITPNALVGQVISGTLNVETWSDFFGGGENS